MTRLALVLGLAALPAFAAPVETALLPDRGAEARLVLAAAPVGGWAVRQAGRRVEVLFPSAALDIDLSGARALPPSLAARVGTIRSAVAPEGTRLTLTLTCDCAVLVSDDGEARTVIDVVAAGLPPGPLLRARGIAPARAPLPRMRGHIAAEAPAEPHPELAATRERLVAQLERAAAAGLITLRDPRPLEDTPSRGRAANPWALAPGARGPIDRPGPRARVAVTPTAPLAPSDPTPEGTEDRGCWPDTALAVGPQEPGAFGERLGPLRAALLGEFDRPQPAAAERLARFYLAHGLAEEADTIAKAVSPGEAGAPLHAMAAALAGRPAPALRRDPPCPGLHGVWSALAAERFPPGLRAGPLVDALEPEPEPLRSQIATRLALAAARAGRWSEARALRALASRADRAGRRPSDTRLLLDGLLARGDGSPDAARDAFAELWARGGPVAPEATVALAEMVLAGSVGAGRDTRLLRLDLGALAWELRGTDMGARALAAEARLAARALGRDTAMGLLALGVRTGLTEAETQASALDAIATDAQAQDSATPLALAYARDPARFRAALREPGFRGALIRSFADIGLPERGDALLEPGDLSDPDLAAALGRAFVSARPARALELSARLPDRAASARLAADALQALGRPADALARLRDADLGSPEERARLAWAAEDWAGAQAELAAQFAARPDPDTAARLALARARAGAPAPPPGPFSDDMAAVPAPETDEIAAYLETLRRETALMKEMLEDG